MWENVAIYGTQSIFQDEFLLGTPYCYLLYKQNVVDDWSVPLAQRRQTKWEMECITHKQSE